MDELQHGRISIRPYDARKRTYAMPVMLFTYNICQRSDNARVGGELQFAHPLRAIRPLLYMDNSLSKPPKRY